MHVDRPIRGFTLRELLTWLSLIGVGCGAFYWIPQADQHSYRLGCFVTFLAWGCWLAVLIGVALALQRSWKHSLLVAALLIASYPGSYLILSFYGRYEGAVYGLDGPKFYAWAPVGFVDNRRWNGRLMVAYRPLYLLDEWYWHRDYRGYPQASPYPINP